MGTDDTIILATEHVDDRPAACRRRRGRRQTVLTSPDRSARRADHVWPELLPGGRAVLFTITALTGGRDAAQVAVLDLQTGHRTVLVQRRQSRPLRAERPSDLRGGRHATWRWRSTWPVWRPTGRRSRSFRRWCRRRWRRRTPWWRATARSAYVSGERRRVGNAAHLVWVDRQGPRTPIPAPPRPYLYPRLSPDGTRVAVEVVDQERDIWVWDLARPTLTRITFDPGYDGYPVWTPDGAAGFSSDRDGGTESLLARRPTPPAPVERLTDESDIQQYRNGRVARRPSADLHRDRRRKRTTTSWQLHDWTATRPRDAAGAVLVRRARTAVVSPDGRWLAYEANDSGAVRDLRAAVS